MNYYRTYAEGEDIDGTLTERFDTTLTIAASGEYTRISDETYTYSDSSLNYHAWYVNRGTLSVSEDGIMTWITTQKAYGLSPDTNISTYDGWGDVYWLETGNALIVDSILYSGSPYKRQIPGSGIQGSWVCDTFFDDDYEREGVTITEDSITFDYYYNSTGDFTNDTPWDTDTYGFALGEDSTATLTPPGSDPYTIQYILTDDYLILGGRSGKPVTQKGYTKQ